MIQIGSRLFYETWMHDFMLNLKRIPALDGLRGLAILLVMADHLFWWPDSPAISSLFSFGWIGVDLFFVLSGFLITGVLDDARGTPHALKFFYFRRVLRIFPGYYLYLILYYFAVVHFQWIHFGADKTAEAAHDLRWSWWYGTNLLIAREGHFITASLNHFWTLAVEEHFYLFWPVLVLLLGRSRSFFACIGIAIGVFFLRCFLSFGMHLDTVAIHVLTPCRIDSFTIGGALALFVRHKKNLRLRNSFFRNVFIGCAFSLCLLFYREGDSYGTLGMQTIGYTLLAVFFMSIMGCIVTESTWIGLKLKCVFEARLLQWFGKYSYALYVIHHPLNIAIRRLAPRVIQLSSPLYEGVVTVIVFLGSLLLAKLSWELIEKRFLRLKHHFES